LNVAATALTTLHELEARRARLRAKRNQPAEHHGSLSVSRTRSG
jgi:hypothetical protein